MAKKRKSKIPKRVAGIKIPKRVRKGPVAEFLSSHTGQIAVAEALALAAGALAVKRDADNGGEAVRHPIDSLRNAGGRAADAMGDRSARFARAMREAAQTFRQVMNEEDAQQPAVLDAGTVPTATATVDDLMDTPAKKKRGTSSTAASTEAAH